MLYQPLHKLISKNSEKLQVEKKGSKIIYFIKELDHSYLLDDGHGVSYSVGKFPGSIANEPIWRLYTKVSSG